MLDLEGSVRAPEFPAGMQWLNTDKPLTMADLRGKIVLLDFWTYCCINCIHIIPELHKLEEQFPDSLVVIGVHAPKYSAEQITDNIRQAILRYDIRHPVVNDKNHDIWDSYAVSAWPTIALVSPEGRLIGEHPGEFEAPDFAKLIESVEDEFARNGKLDRSPIHFPLLQDKEPKRTLNFPGKVLADADRGRIFIADSSHNRILMTDMDGRTQAVIGNGQPGMDDGDFESATFHGPQGMELAGNILYVADTENHTVRRVDLDNRRVERTAGTGEQSRVSRRGGPALSTALSSPWDLALNGDTLYIAMAGNHQIWALDIKAAELHRFAGTGREALSDGPLERCALAQTSGLSYADDKLYFTDSETSSIRVADIKADMVETIVGQGLFVFGDVDGNGPEARLQHCLGVAHHDGMLYVADSYNNKIKVIDTADGSSRTFLGTGEARLRDGSALDASFWEPGGLSISGGKIFIADTNNNAIRVADMHTREVSTLAITE